MQLIRKGSLFSPSTITYEGTRSGEFCQWDRGRCKVHRGSPSCLLSLCRLMRAPWYLVYTCTPVRRPNTTFGRRARARTCHASFSNGLCRAASEGTHQREESSVMQNSREGLKNGGNAIQSTGLFIIEEVVSV